MHRIMIPARMTALRMERHFFIVFSPQSVAMVSGSGNGKLLFSPGASGVRRNSEKATPDKGNNQFCLMLPFVFYEINMNKQTRSHEFFTNNPSAGPYRRAALTDVLPYVRFAVLLWMNSFSRMTAFTISQTRG